MSTTNFGFLLMGLSVGSMLIEIYYTIQAMRMHTFNELIGTLLEKAVSEEYGLSDLTLAEFQQRIELVGIDMSLNKVRKSWISNADKRKWWKKK